MKRAFITGATGFIGRHLAAGLRHREVEVHALVRSDSDTTGLDAMADSVRCHVYDGSTTGLLACLDVVRPDAVFHLAAFVSAEHGLADVEPMVHANVLLGTQVVEACLQAGVPRFVNTGTFWQHYSGEGYDPVCLYAATKEAFERILDYYTEATTLRALTLTLFDVYGPHDDRGKLLTLLQRAQREGCRLALSPGAQELDLVHVTDVVAAYVQAAKLLEDQPEAVNGRNFAISSGVRYSLREVVDTFERVSGTHIAVDWGARPYRSREVMTPWHGPALPGWEARVPLEEGLSSLIELDSATSSGSQVSTSPSEWGLPPSVHKR